jgi:phosphomannomutase/phosphomannomutase/phosphoglucomutase
MTETSMNLKAFKAYDVRGRIPDEINTGLARQIGHAYAAHVKPRKVVVGRDIRHSSDELVQALTEGLLERGVDVYDIGLCGTEGVYYATFAERMDGGIMVTASHNPPDYNGMKFVREDSRPISGDTGLFEMRDWLAAQTTENLVPGTGYSGSGHRAGKRHALATGAKYLEHLLGYVDRSKLRRLRVVVNAGNGGAGLIVDQLEPHLPFEFVKLNNAPDGSFPNGVPNPMLEANRAPTIEAIRRSGADVGIAWDGDYDRCFFFDEQGTFIEGYYLVGLLAEVFLKREPGGRIVHDPRLTWNTIDVVRKNGGKAVLSKSGHAFIKQVMREVDGIYGGEMSAHHYFRDFSYCDSGMIPWLIVLQVMCETGKTLSQLVGERMRLFPASGEINCRVPDGPGTIAAIRAKYEPQSSSVDFTDGLSLEFDRWRMNLRTSNTEPLIRLNVESRGDAPLMQAKTEEVLGEMARLGAVAADH